jgi:hypothetical protein
MQHKAAIDPEYIRVELRDPALAEKHKGARVLINGVDHGTVGRTLSVSHGTCTVSVAVEGAIPVDVKVSDTEIGRPMIVVIDVEPC